MAMEQDKLESMIWKGSVNANTETSDSSSITGPIPLKKRARQGSSLTSTKFKGVVPQQNGNWGAQIYANHQRIWLGTFKSEKDAAMAYDSAAIKLRSGDCYRNFPWTKITVEEPHFQNHYTTEAVLDMIKDGSYQFKFFEYLTARSHTAETENGFNSANINNKGWVSCKQLFQKELTPSDVGKLNRLVVPKKHAINYFPRISENTEEEETEGEVGSVDDMQLVFCDRMMRQWKFRYCYWKSSQSFVFTRGWNRFVKEKQLEANDTITFYLCEHGGRGNHDRTFCMIDISKSRNGVQTAEDANQTAGVRLYPRFELGQNDDHDENKEEDDDDLAVPVAERDDGELTHETKEKGFRLFGVRIV